MLISSEKLNVEPCGAKWQWFDYDAYMNSLQQFREERKRSNNPVNGKLVVAVRDEHDKVHHESVRITKNKIVVKPCKVNITVKNEKDKQPAKSEDEKLGLLKAYWDEHGTLPAKNTMYEGFRLGAFCQQLLRQKHNIQTAESIIENELVPDLIDNGEDDK